MKRYFLRLYYKLNNFFDGFICGFLSCLALSSFSSVKAEESVFDFVPVSDIVFSSGFYLDLGELLNSSYDFEVDWSTSSSGYSAPFRVVGLKNNGSLGAYSNPGSSSVHFFGRTFNNVEGTSYSCSYRFSGSASVPGVACCNGQCLSASPVDYSGPLYLGGFWQEGSFPGSGSWFKGSVSRLKITNPGDNNVVLLDLVPVSNGTSFGFVDRVSGKSYFSSSFSSSDAYSGNLFLNIFKCNTSIFKNLTLSDLFLEYLPFSVALVSVVMFIKIRRLFF